MITKRTAYLTEEGVRVIEYPELDHINMGDPEIQRDLIKWGVAVGIPGGEMFFTRPVRLIAAKGA